MSTPTPGLDDLDRALIDALRRDGRATNRALGEVLGVAETTVAARLRRMSDEGVMRVIALTDMRAAGYEYFSLVGVRVAERDMVEVANELAVIPEVAAVASVLGRFDLIVSVMARDQPHLLELLEERIGGVKGIQALESHLALEITAYHAEFATL